MALGLGDSEIERRDEKRGREIQDLVICICRNFSLISETRLHNLAFLSEYKHYVDYGERPTSADYRPYLQGCHSEKIDLEIDNIEGIERRKTKIQGKRVKTLKITGNLNCTLNDEVTESIDFVTKSYGDIPSKEILKVIFDVSIYTETDSGDVIEFSKT